MIEFPLFDFVPDLSSAPKIRFGAEIDTVSHAPAPVLLAWPWARAERIQALSFAFDTRAELARFKAFFEARGGRCEVFLAPSWCRDFEIAELPASGATEVEIALADYGTDYLATTDLDAIGRYVFCCDATNGLHMSKVLEATDGTTSTLTLEQPLPFAPAETAIWGFCYISRFDEDNLDFGQITEAHGEAEVVIRAIPCAAETELEGTLAEGEPIYETLPFTAYTVDDEERDTLRQNVSYALGPQNLHFTQDALFDDQWAAWYGTASVRIGKRTLGDVVPPDDGEGVASGLFDGLPANTEHLSLAFDQTSFEMLAYQPDRETVAVRRWFNFAPREDTFPGFSPLLHFNGVLNAQAVIDGTTDVLCFYVKPGHAQLFARAQRDNFGVEYVASGMPSLPIALLSITDDPATGDGVVLLRYVDDGFRVGELLVELPEQPSIPPSPFVAGAFGDMAGAGAGMAVDYFEEIIDGGDDEDTAGAGVGLFVDYALEIVENETPADEAGAGQSLLVENLNLIVTDIETERAGAGSSLSAAHAFVVVESPAIGEDSGASQTLSIGYAPS